jgi:hypothetical protein
MARKFCSHTGKWAWNPDRAEEIVLILGYEEIRAYIPPDAGWRREFEMFFYERGSALGFHHLGLINGARKRKGLRPIVFLETDISDYGRELDRGVRTQRRCDLRDELLAMNQEERTRALVQAQEQVREMPPPHRTFEEWRDGKAAIEAENALSREEVRRRAAAVKAQTVKGNGHANGHAQQEDARLAKFRKMLNLVGEQVLRDEIISGLTADEALELAEEYEKPETRDALIRRSLSGMTVQ